MKQSRGDGSKSVEVKTKGKCGVYSTGEQGAKTYEGSSRFVKQGQDGGSACVGGTGRGGNRTVTSGGQTTNGVKGERFWGGEPGLALGLTCTFLRASHRGVRDAWERGERGDLY